MDVTNAAAAAVLMASLGWEQLPPIPDSEGFAGCFAGVAGGALVVAGGANFPAGRPWEGGKKTWHDRVFVLEHGGSGWRVAGRLPRPLAYGVSVTHEGRVICCGGSDDSRHHDSVFALAWDGTALRVEPLPSLPRPLAQHAGAVVGRHLVVGGGTETPADTTASRRVWRLDLARPAAGWQEDAPLPGPGRILATAAACEGGFYLIGGTGLQAGADGRPVRLWLRDAYCCDPDRTWRRIADLPRPAVGAPSPACVTDNRLVILGGDDGAHVGTPPDKHPGFCREPLVYDAHGDSWSVGPALPFALVTTPAVIWNDAVVIPGGEVRPGVRSTAVWLGRPNRTETPRENAP